MIRVIITNFDGRRWVHMFPDSTNVITVGRGPESDIQISDRRASRRQLALHRADLTWTIEDRSGRGTTKLNGIRLDGPAPLSLEDQITFGRSKLELAESMPRCDDEPTVGETWSGYAVADAKGDIHVASESPAFVNAIELARRIAPTEETVLLRGETGTGKEVFARLLHESSLRSSGPLVVVNCPGLPESLFESELFGVEKGVATGVSPRPGRLAQANGGTVLLDEIGDLSALAQAKLLRFLQDKKVDRVGGDAPVPVDVRVVAATNVDLEESIAAGRFRADLYHRLAAFTITLPPLRERRMDIPALVEHFLAREGAGVHFSPAALATLQRYSFPGNIRELELIVRQTSLLSRGEVIDPDDLPDPIRKSQPATSPTVSSEPSHDEAEVLWVRIVGEGEDFWAAVRKPFLNRELSRKPIQALVARALSEGGGSYAKAARLLHVGDEYRKFVDFLRHNQLRPGDR